MCRHPCLGNTGAESSRIGSHLGVLGTWGAGRPTLPMLPKISLDQRVQLGGQGCEEQTGLGRLFSGRSWVVVRFTRRSAGPTRPTRSQSWLWVEIL